MPIAGKLDWVRFGEIRLGMRGEQVLAVIAPGDESVPTKLFAVSYPDHWFVSIPAAMAYAETHSRCATHGIAGCGLCTGEMA